MKLISLPVFVQGSMSVAAGMTSRVLLLIELGPSIANSTVVLKDEARCRCAATVTRKRHHCDETYDACSVGAIKLHNNGVCHIWLV